jgi:hypothetical protein
MLESSILERARETSIKTMNFETVVLVHGVGLGELKFSLMLSITQV